MTGYNSRLLLRPTRGRDTTFGMISFVVGAAAPRSRHARGTMYFATGFMTRGTMFFHDCL